MRLYHNHLSSCSQKVRMALHEKKLAFENTLVDLQKGEQFSSEYLLLNPNGVVPTLEDNGHILIESTLINEYLDDAYPQVPLKPASAADRHQMRLFCKDVDDALHPACGVITYAIGARPSLLTRPQEEIDALIDKIPNAARRSIRRSVVDKGVQAPEFREAMLTYRALFDRANELLTDNPWLTGSTFTLADCALMPYVLRVDHLGQINEITSRPHLARWFDSIQERPAFQEAVTKWTPSAMVKLFKNAGEAVAIEIAQVMSRSS
ncbi:MAG: glutathione S-transferase [Oceanicoccus sp.]|jgi:glutathione S-transferase